MLDAIRRAPNSEKLQHRLQYDDIAEMPIGPRGGIPKPTISEPMDSISFRHAEGLMIDASQQARAGQIQGDYASAILQNMSAEAGIPHADMRAMAEDPLGTRLGSRRRCVRACSAGTNGTARPQRSG